MTDGRLLVILNPAARKGTAAELAPAIRELLAVIPHDTVTTTHPGHAVDLAASASAYTAVIAAGGDGTAHEVVNGLMRHAPENRPAFGIIPVGTGNDTRRMLGIPQDIARAALIVAAGARRPMDVGTCNGTYFSNSFSVGFDAQVNARAVERKVTSGQRGMLLYLTSLLHVLFRELRPARVSLSVDGLAAEQRDVLSIAATIGPTYGGGFRISPAAVPDDGLLDVCVIDPITVAQALPRLPFVIVGKHACLKPVHMSLHQSLIIESETTLTAQTDGELIFGTRFEIGIVPRALDCIVPRN